MKSIAKFNWCAYLGIAELLALVPVPHGQCVVIAVVHSQQQRTTILYRERERERACERRREGGGKHVTREGRKREHRDSEWERVREQKEGEISILA